MRARTQSEVFEGPAAVDLALPPLHVRRTVGSRSILKTSEADVANALLIVLLPIILGEALLHSAAKALWFDEILTTVVSSQGHISDMWGLLRNGVDGHPISFYLIEHLMGKLGGNERIVLRLPSIAAFFGVMTCMFVFIRRRAGSLIAVISASSLLLTNLYDPFAFEARSYCVMAACMAFALLCYERVNSWKWAGIFAVSLAAACSLHFYAAISFFPFGLAELTEWATTKRFRARVWGAFLVGVLPYFAFWPILREQRELYGAHFWAAPTLWKLMRSFGELLNLETGISVAVFAATSIFLLYLAYKTRLGEWTASHSGSGFSLSDIVLALGFLAMPVVTFILAKVGHGGITGRYVLTAALGFSLAVAVLLSRLKTPAILCAGFIVLCMFGLQEAAEWRYVLSFAGAHDPMEVLSQESRHLGVPVVLSDNLEYLPEWHRANDDFKSRMFTFADSDIQYSVTDNNTPSLLLVTLRKYAPIQAPYFSEFSQEHRKFLLYSDATMNDYWPRWLAQQGYDLRIVTVLPPVKGIRDNAPDPPRSILYFVDLDARK